jgi:hypothetical protein
MRYLCDSTARNLKSVVGFTPPPLSAIPRSMSESTRPVDGGNDRTFPMLNYRDCFIAASCVER